MGTQDVDTVEWCDESFESLNEERGRPKPLLLGLPCSRCKVYYEGELTTCPICGSTKRVSPTEASRVIRPKSRAA
jgi:rRNA maturation endonuclease Nob1